MKPTEEPSKQLKEVEDEQFLNDMKRGLRRYKASGPLLIFGVALLALSAGLAKKSDILGASVAVVGILLILAGITFQDH
jgi:hypothetical protein